MEHFNTQTPYSWIENNGRFTRYYDVYSLLSMDYLKTSDTAHKRDPLAYEPLEFFANIKSVIADILGADNFVHTCQELGSPSHIKGTEFKGISVLFPFHTHATAQPVRYKVKVAGDILELSSGGALYYDSRAELKIPRLLSNGLDLYSHIIFVGNAEFEEFLKSFNPSN